MKWFRFGALFAVISLAVMGLGAQGAALKPVFGFDDGDLWWAQFDAGVEGFEAVPGVPSRALVYLGGGYFSDGYYRDASGAPLVDPSFDFPGAAFHQWGAETRFGVDLGLLRAPAGDGNLLEAQLYLRDVWRSPIDAPAAYAGTLDGKGFLENSLFAGLSYKGAPWDLATRTRDGVNAEASLEWAPSFLLNDLIGSADWWRLSARASYFASLVKSPAFGLYLGDRFIVDLVGGAALPSHAQRQIGGFSPLKAMGGAVRGIANFRYDGTLKFVNNVDLRATLPSLFGKVVVPEFFVFCDQGLVDKGDYFAGGKGDFLLTAGAGIVIDVLAGSSPLDLGYYVSYSITEGSWNFFNLVILAYQF